MRFSIFFPKGRRARPFLIKEKLSIPDTHPPFMTPGASVFHVPPTLLYVFLGEPLIGCIPVSRLFWSPAEERCPSSFPTIPISLLALFESSSRELIFRFSYADVSSLPQAISTTPTSCAYKG